MKRIAMVLVAMVIVGSLVGAQATAVDAVDQDPSGRIVSARGTLQTLSGTLRWERDEWFLATDSHALYELHLGPYGHQDEPLFTGDVAAVVEGFVYGDHIAPVTVATAGDVHRFWATDRMPLWAGSGEGGGRVAQTNPEIPMGQRIARDNQPEKPQAEETQRGFRNEPGGAGRFRN